MSRLRVATARSSGVKPGASAEVMARRAAGEGTYLSRRVVSLGVLPRHAARETAVFYFFIFFGASDRGFANR